MNTQTNYFKKALVVLMAVMMVFTMMPSMAWAAEDDGANAEDYINEFSLKTSGGKNPALHAVVKTAVDREYNVYLPDTTVGYFMFSNTSTYNEKPLYYQAQGTTKDGETNTSPVGGGITKIPATLMFQSLTTVGISTNTTTTFPVGAATTKKLIVGTSTDGKTFEDTEATQTYTFHYFRQVMLNSLTVSADDEKLNISPAFDKINEENYGVQVSNTSKTLTLNLGVKTPLAAYDAENVITKAGTSLDFGDAAEAVLSKNGSTVSFEIEKLPVAKDTGKKYIPITVSYLMPSTTESGTTAQESPNVKASYYNLAIDEVNYVPTVTNINKENEYHYDRAAAAEVLGVKVDLDEKLQGEISYQWYRKSYSMSNYSPITDATSSTYTPPTEYVSSTEYYCEVTNLYNGVRYTATSTPVKVIVEATSASQPVIDTEPTDITCYRNSEQTLEIKASSKDRRENLYPTISYQWYQCENDGTNETLLDGETKSSLRVPTDTIGTYYYCCEVTSTINGHSAATKSRIAAVRVQRVVGLESLKGEGTEDEPYKVQSLNDLQTIKSVVEAGQGLEGIIFELTENIELPLEWQPIGGLKDPSLKNGLDDGTARGKNVNPFMGTFDGKNHTVTIAEGGLPLFNFVRKATIKNLNISGKEIASSALIASAFIDYGEDGEYQTGVPWVVKIDNVTLKSGSKTLKTGFLPGSGSGANVVTIMNSTIEKDVIIGYQGQSGGGSFIGDLNGYIINCISYATVNGTGGLAGKKGQSMGPCVITNSAFLGTVKSSGYAGGIIGSGYNGYGSNGVNSAPNTPAVTVKNCYVVADITGSGNVGGILGTEPSVECCWSNGDGTISNNYFKGTLTETSGNGNVGGVVGFMKSFDKYQGFDSNFYAKNCGAKSGIGKIETIITKSHPKYGAAYGIDYVFDEEAVCTGVSDSAFTDQSLAAKLNAGKYSTKNWTQGSEGYPVLSKTPVIYQITLSGNYTKNYNVGDKLDLTGMVITGTYTDGRTEEIPLDEVEVSKLDTSKAGDFELTVRYLAAETKFTVKVRYADPKPAKVSITILGDTDHGDPTDATGTHTLASNNLETWYTGSFEVNQNNTVWDILQLVAKETAKNTKGKISFSNPMGNYVDYVTYDGMKLGEFTNGKNSGWMYTLNGTHPNLGVSEQFLNPGDRIVWHYTDDYTVEEGSDKWGLPTDEVKDVTTDTKTGTTTAPTEVKVSEKTAADGTKEKVAEVKVTADDQKEIIKQAKDNKVKEIILVVSKDDVKDATKADVILDKSFLESIVKDTDAKLTIKTPFGDKTYTQDELKALIAGASGTTITLTIEKSAELDEAAKLEKAKELTASLALTARSAKTAKKNVKVSLKMTKASAASIKEIQDLGYTVKYKFYRSTKKASKYAAKLTKSSKTYLNTSGAKGSKYYYKARVMVYDQDGKLVTYSKLTQCKYATRTWTKAK